MYRLWRSFSFRHCDASVYLSYDVMINAPFRKNSSYDFLWVPANEALVGTRLPYFPVGGPVPPLYTGKDASMASSRWGGMDKGDSMHYPVQCLDGVVHTEAGLDLRAYLLTLPERAPFIDSAGQVVRCPVGQAVVSPSFGLSPYFSALVHTVAPFAADRDWQEKLLSCYKSALSLSVIACDARDGAPQTTMIASVLLGAGTRAISIDGSAAAAARACAEYDPSSATTKVRRPVVHFVLREEDHCEVLADHFAKQYQ
jgi:O-acetyl-ADP-ribose deacetylase (regulator of RNase III)